VSHGDPDDISDGHWDLEPGKGYVRKYTKGTTNTLPYLTKDEYYFGIKEGTKPEPTHYYM
jgi:hypothetical protein